MPPGFSLIEDFIGQEQEDFLSSRIKEHLDASPETRLERYGKDGRSRVTRFRFRNLPDVVPQPEEPDWLKGAMLRFKELGFNDAFNAISINEYSPGGGMYRHIDPSYFDNIILLLNLNADCKFELHKANSVETEIINAKRRSLMVMSGESRYQWEHSVLPVDGTRYSVVWRTHIEALKQFP